MDDNDPKMRLAVNEAVSQLAMLRARPGALYGAMGGGLDAKRQQAWCEYGWRDNLEFADLYAAYSRGGIGYGAVTKLVRRCWATQPWIIEGEEHDNARDETPWERKVKAAYRPRRLWRAFRQADEMRLVGRFAGLLLHIQDGQEWGTAPKRGKALQRLTPVWASALRVEKYDEDVTSPRYGLPLSWSYTTQTRDGVTGGVQSIHWQRIFVLGDWRPSALGFLEPGYNALTNLEKIEGGSGESFLKNAARQVNINFDPQVNLSQIASAHGVPVQDLQRIYDQVTRALNGGIDATVITQGATVTPLTSTVTDPEPSYGINLQTFSASVDMPSKILVGNQTGERASSEDNKSMDVRCQARRNDELTYDAEDFVDHLIMLGVYPPAPAAGFSVVWDNLTESTPGERIETASKMAAMNAQSPGEAYFTQEEVREAGGYEARPSTPLGEDIDDDDDDDPSA